MAKEKSSSQVISINVLCTLCINMVSMITMPILSRLLGTEGYGLISIYTTWATIFTVISGLQVNVSIANANIDFSREEQKKYQSSIFVLSALWTGILLMAAVVGNKAISSLLQMPRWMPPLMILHSFGMFSVNFWNSKFTYELKPEKNFIVSVGASVSVAALSIAITALLPQEQRYYGKILGTGVPYVAIGCISVLVLLKHGKTGYNKKYWKYCLSLCLPMVASGLCSNIFGQSDRLMLQRMATNSAVGIYSLSFNFSNIIGSIWMALNTAWCPYYYRMEEHGDYEELFRRLKKYTRLFTVLTIGFILLSKEIFVIYAGEEFVSGAMLIPIFAAGFYAQFIYSIAVNYEYYQKQMRYISVLTILSSLVNVGLNGLLIPELGAEGAALATLAAYIINALLHWYVAKHCVKTDHKFRIQLCFFIPYILAVLMAVTLFYLIPSSFWGIRWGIGALIGVWQLRYLYKSKTIF